MEIKCSGCDRAEARVFCCADEAALCLKCDEKIHAANKLVSKHQRVSLSSTSSSPRPKCDICQETIGYFLCLEDRALLCRKCDVAIHTVNSFVSGHQRFLLTGAKVGLESAELGKSTGTDSLAAGLPQVAVSSRDGNLQVAGRSYGGSKVAAAAANAAISGSRTKDILDLIDSNDNYPSSQNISSKAEDKVHGNSEWWKILRSTEEELLNGEWTTPDDASWTVPELFRQYPQQDSVSSRGTGRSSSNNTINISDAAGCPPAGAGSQYHLNSISTKRRRHKTY